MSLSIEFARTCNSNYSFRRNVPGSHANMYNVTWEPTPNGDVQYGWHCDCKAFEYGGGKLCKHILQVKDERCGWNAELDTTAQADASDMCPECGFETSVERVVV